MKSTSEIEKAVISHFKNNPSKREYIDNIGHQMDEFFNFFITSVKLNDYLVVSYLLNNCFNSTEERAEFGNRQDEKGNTAFHYAAMLGHDEIITILNDKRSYQGKMKFFKFNTTNNEGETPLDLCCKFGQVNAFNTLWPRAGKSNHNPTSSFRNACIGSNLVIIGKVISHPKFNIKEPLIHSVISDVLAGQFGDTVKDFINTKLFNQNNKQKPGNSNSLKRHGIFKQESEADKSRDKKSRIELKI